MWIDIERTNLYLEAAGEYLFSKTHSVIATRASIIAIEARHQKIMACNHKLNWSVNHDKSSEFMSHRDVAIVWKVLERYPKGTHV